VQVWCAATLITDIRHRVVSLRMLDITGTLRCCKKAAASFNAAVLAERHLTPQARPLNASRPATQCKRSCGYGRTGPALIDGVRLPAPAARGGQ
jgi:hypothetical protein